jgi:Icc-related predicted phosphoesterase
MVKIQIASDLHIETQDDVPSAKDYITPSADILILAGDIGRIHKFDQLKTFITDICSQFQAVIYVPGNHEYYKVDDIAPKNMYSLKADLYSIKKDIENLYIMDRSSIVIDDVCIFGCTLWSEPKAHVPRFIVRIQGITTEKYNAMYQRDLLYIENMIKYCHNKQLIPVVVTHHPPTHKVTGTKVRDRFRFLYGSDLDHLLDIKKVHTWICGHVHVNFDMVTEGGTRLVSNQKGKPKDKVEDFSKDKVITIESLI